MPALSPWLLVMCSITFSVMPWCASQSKGQLRPLHISLLTPTTRNNLSTALPPEACLLCDCTSCWAFWAGTSWRICVLWYLRAKQHVLLGRLNTKCQKKYIYFVLKILHLTPAGPISSLPPSLDHSSDLCILKMNTTAVIGVSHMWVAVFLFSGTEWCCWN